MGWPQYFCIQQAQQCVMQGLLQRACVKEKVLPLNPIVHSLGAACIDAAVAWVHDRASLRCLADQVPAEYWQTCSVEFSSRWYLYAQERPFICFPSSLSEVSLVLPLKRLQCSSDWWRPSLIKCLLSLHLSPPGDRWCDVFGFVPACR